jgi:transcription antitermination factor NusG
VGLILVYVHYLKELLIVNVTYPNYLWLNKEFTGERHWYAIHTYSGYENAVLRNLKQRIESLGMQDKIFAVVVPLEKKIKVKGTKRVEVEEKIYPGYVLVDMVVDDNSWYVVRNTPRVTGFVGGRDYSGATCTARN